MCVTLVCGRPCRDRGTVRGTMGGRPTGVRKSTRLDPLTLRPQGLRLVAPPCVRGLSSRRVARSRVDASRRWSPLVATRPSGGVRGASLSPDKGRGVTRRSRAQCPVLRDRRWARPRASCLRSDATGAHWGPQGGRRIVEMDTGDSDSSRVPRGSPVPVLNAGRRGGRMGGSCGAQRPSHEPRDQ